MVDQAIDVNPDLFESIGVPAPLEEAVKYGDPVDVTDYLRDSPGFDYEWNSGTSAASQIDDRFDGRYVPVYRHEIDLKIVRAMSWLLHERVPMAKAWVERLRDYTIGTGFDWTITSADDVLAKACKALVDRTLADNDWTSELERETYEREVIDGESILQLEMHADCGSVELMTREADELTQPADHRQLEDYYGFDWLPSSWSFGVHTELHKTSKPLGYHFVRDAAGRDWDYVPVDRVCHWKRNVRRTAKRGFGDFYTPHVYLGKGDKVLKHTSNGVAIQAAIAYIVEHAPGTTQKQAAGMTGLRKYAGRFDPTTDHTPNHSKIHSGTRIDVRNGQKYHAGPLGTNNSRIYVEVMQAAIRLAGTVKAFPEGMLTGDYANANYASALVAQSPFVQGRIAEQNERANRKRRMILKILGLFADHGALQAHGISCAAELRARVEVKVTPPNVIPEDRKGMAEALEIEKRNGWLSDKTAMQELGRDYEAEKSNGAAAVAITTGIDANPDPMTQNAAGEAPGAQAGITGTATVGPDGQPIQPQIQPQAVVPQVDPNTTQAPAVAAVANDPAGDVQSTGLNGAQIDGMLTITQSVLDGILPIESAKVILSQAFPLMSQEAVAGILEPLRNHKPPAPPVVPGQIPPAPGQPPQQLNQPEPPKPPVAEAVDPILANLTEGQRRVLRAWGQYP